jgi:hypothetical protein
MDTPEKPITEIHIPLIPIFLIVGIICLTVMTVVSTIYDSQVVACKKP